MGPNFSPEGWKWGLICPQRGPRQVVGSYGRTYVLTRHLRDTASRLCDSSPGFREPSLRGGGIHEGHVGTCINNRLAGILFVVKTPIPVSSHHLRSSYHLRSKPCVDQAWVELSTFLTEAGKLSALQSASERRGNNLKGLRSFV